MSPRRVPDAAGGGSGRRPGDEAPAPTARRDSYYGRPILKPPTWEARDIAGYFFLGGLAGGSSILGAGAELSGRPRMARSCKLAALGAASLSLVALVHDLGKPERFVNMLRVFKPTSPMSVGSWLLGAYGPAAGGAALLSLTGRLPRTGRVATLGAALLGSGLASYTGALISDTAVPAWHDGYRQMPFVFVGSAASAAGGLATITSPLAEAAPARRTGALGALLELSSLRLMERSMGGSAEAMREGRAGRLLHLSEALTGLGAVLDLTLARRRRGAAWVAGAALLGGSAATRFGIFAAGVQSAADPRYTVEPQRARLAESRVGPEMAGQVTPAAPA